MGPKLGQIHLQAVLFALPVFGVYLLVAPVFVLGGIYARYYDLSLVTIATIFLASRIFDAATDPFIGVWSDYLRVRTGSRKRLIGGGVIMLAVSAWFLYVPPEGLAGTAWFCIWFLVFYLGLTMFDLPYLAWVGDLYPDAAGRSLFFSAHQCARQGGMLLFYLLPLLPLTTTQEFTPEVLRSTAVIGIIIVAIGSILSVRYLPNGQLGATTQSRRPKTNLREIASYVRSFLDNKPFLVFLGLYVSACIANGAWLGLFFIYVDSYLGLGHHYALISVIGMGTGLFAALTARTYLLRLGTRGSLYFTVILLIACYLFSGLLTPRNANFAALTFIFCANMFSMGVFVVVTNTLLTTIADYGAYKKGVSNLGGYFSTLTFLAKAQYAFGSGIGLAIAGFFGFDASGGSSVEQTTLAIFGLKLGAAWFPCVFGLLCIVFISRVALDTRRGLILQRALKRRSERASI